MFGNCLSRRGWSIAAFPANLLGVKYDCLVETTLDRTHQRISTIGATAPNSVIVTAETLDDEPEMPVAVAVAGRVR